jgi:predicted Zn-dependent protease
VKVTQRRAVIAVALTLGFLSAPVALLAQTRSAAPSADTPRLLVAVCASNDRLSGVQAADAMRTRIQSGANVRQLYVIPKADITNYLESSGYKADSSLGPSDLKELAKLLRADEVLFCTVTRTASGMRVEPRLLLARDVSLGQPLPAVDAANPADMARQIERSLQEARKQLVDNKACENSLRDRAYDKAIAAALAGIAKYPNATLARLCLASAYQEKKLPPDSVLRVTDEVRRIDPKNSFALRLAYGAYDAKNDQENAVRTLVALLKLEPTNQSLQSQVVGALAKLGRPSIAIPIVDTLLLQNPGDPQLLRQKWLLTLQAAAGADSAARPGLIEQAVKSGEEMVRADTMLADSTFFARQIVTALAWSPVRGSEVAARAVQKFPNIAEFWALKAQAERKAGQLQMAQQSLTRALSIDPKIQAGNLLLAQIYVETNQPDSAVAVARRAIASGEDAKTWGAFLLAPTQAAFKAAQASQSTADYQRALTLAQESDKLSQSATAKFFVGVASFQIGIDAVREADVVQRQKRPDKAKICTFARTAQDMFLLTQVNMPAGGSVDANTAKQILTYVAQYAPAADQMVKQNCK